MDDFAPDDREIYDRVVKVIVRAIHEVTGPAGNKVSLHTMCAAAFVGGQQHRGALSSGRLADLTIWSTDITTSDPQALRDQNPELIIVGGRSVHTTGLAVA